MVVVVVVVEIVTLPPEALTEVATEVQVVQVVQELPIPAEVGVVQLKE
jgi:hypothetical protein